MWNTQINGETQEETSASFKEAEWFIKRNYAASLVRDEGFVAFEAGKPASQIKNMHRGESTIPMHIS
ncbi:hypothetical protein CPT06_17950 [Bacillus vallismortis]|nr:hypothetical protein CPT06_17950 [Bacillus vallismortis]